MPDLDTVGQFELEPPGLGYSPLNAYWLAQCSVLAYLKPESVADVLLDAWDFDEVETGGFSLPGITTEFWFATAPKWSVLAYRGTTDPADWAQNVQAQLVEFQGLGKAHSGFVCEAGAASRVIRVPQDRPLFITGHSKGAAQALIEAGWRAARRYTGLHCVYAFASPRVYDWSAAGAYNYLVPDTYRFEHNNDLVCRVPSTWRGYKHVGRLIYFDRLGARHHEPPSATYRLWDRICGRFRGGIFDGTRDHSKWTYARLAASDLALEVAA